MCPNPFSKEIKLVNPELMDIENEEVNSDTFSDTDSDDEPIVFTCLTEIDFLQARNIELFRENQSLVKERDLLALKNDELKLGLEYHAVSLNELELKIKNLQEQMNWLKMQHNCVGE